MWELNRIIIEAREPRAETGGQCLQTEVANFTGQLRDPCGALRRIEPVLQQLRVVEVNDGHPLLMLDRRRKYFCGLIARKICCLGADSALPLEEGVRGIWRNALYDDRGCP